MRWKQKEGEEVPPADTWLSNHASLLGSGVALDLACGRGRNSLFLAAAGYRVVALDCSQTALDILTRAACKRQLNVQPRHHDLTTGLPPQPQNVDLLLCCYYLQRNLFPSIRARISPGGLFIGRSFCQSDNLAPASDIIYRPGELANFFSDWDIIDYEEGVEPSPRGGTLAGIVARRPSSPRSAP